MEHPRNVAWEGKRSFAAANDTPPFHDEAGEKMGHPRRLTTLFDVVIGGFAGDDYVVDVGLFQASVRDADEAGVLL